MSSVGGVNPANMLRITGLSTGIDTDEMVKKMTLAEQARIDKVNQSSQLVEWKQKEYRDIISKITEFKDKYFDVLSDDYLLSGNAMSAFDINTEDKTGAVKLTAASGAESGKYQITVASKAKPATIVGTTENKVSRSDKMSTFISGKVSFQINDGETISYDFDGEDKDKSIDDILKDISSKAGVKASYSELSGKFSIESLKTGKSQQLSIKADNDNTNDFLSKLFGAADYKTNAVSKEGSNAVVGIKDPNIPDADKAIEVTNENNIFTIDNVTYNINDITSGAIEFNVNQNVDDSFDKIEKFLEDYNKIVEEINTKLTESKNRNYTPLTDAQKESMSEEQIEKWEEKAKEGLLRNDTELSSMLSQFRSAFYAPVEDAGINFGNYGIGIDTSSDYKDGGKIKISDQKKLKEVLKNNLDEVVNLFTQKSNSVPSYSRNLSQSDKTKRYNEEGICQRISDIINDYTSTFRDENGKKGSLIEKAGIKNDTTFIKNTLTEQIKKYAETIEELTEKMYDKQDYYYSMFANLETAMGKLNDQSNWLTQQLGSM